ncbi:hypothetical protein Q3G72_032152 [Acer saccharum]|nr:hypothetical protein Q3G72_032152 [Acer saccharum]
MDLSPPFTVIEGGRNKDNLSAMENENSDDLKHQTYDIGKPPRHLSAMRLCVSSTRLAVAADLGTKCNPIHTIHALSHDSTFPSTVLHDLVPNDLGFPQNPADLVFLDCGGSDLNPDDGFSRSWELRRSP